MIIARFVTKLVRHCNELIARHLRQIIKVDYRSAIARTAPYDVARCRLVEPFSVETMRQVDGIWE